MATTTRVGDAGRWNAWRRLRLAKPAALPSPLQQEVAPFVTPPAEQEDRRAPPPSVPAGEQTPAAATGGAPRTPGAPGGPTPPQGTQPPAGTGAPGSQPRGATGYPSPGLPTPPPPTTSSAASGQGTQPATQPLYKNVSPDSPLNRSGPMGDADPPPSLPFGPALVAPEQPTRGREPAARGNSASIAECEAGDTLRRAIRRRLRRLRLRVTRSSVARASARFLSSG